MERVVFLHVVKLYAVALISAWGGSNCSLRVGRLQSSCTDLQSHRRAATSNPVHHQVWIQVTTSIAGLHRDPVIESGTSRILIGSDFEIHLVYNLASDRGEWTKLCSDAHLRFHGLIHDFQIAAISELEIRLDWISPRRTFGGIGSEEELEAFARLVNHEIGVPVSSPPGIADQTLGALHLLFDNVRQARFHSRQQATGISIISLRMVLAELGLLRAQHQVTPGKPGLWA